MISFEAAVYLLCFLSSSLCAYLLVVAFNRRNERLLLWSAICFCLLAANNLFVFLDIVILPAIDLAPWRSLTAILAIVILLYGFIWEIE